jgi:hypothetical protein
MNVYMIETPHQLLNAIEAKESLALRDNHLVILLLDEYPVDAYKPLVDFGDWDGIIYVSCRRDTSNRLSAHLRSHRWERVRGYFETWELLGLRRRLDAVAHRLGESDNVFLGNYWREHMRHFGHTLKHRRLCLLDDGTATLYVNMLRNKEFTGKSEYGVDRLKTDLVNKIIGLRSDQARKVTYFTTYDLETIKEDDVIKNTYEFFRSRAKKIQPSSDIFFLGMTLYDEGFTDELYIEHLQHVRDYFGEENFVYIPHKCEPQARVDRLVQTLGLRVKRFDVPIEYQLSIRGTMPKVLASFFSSALENCRVMFGSHLNIMAFYLSPELFPLKPEFVENVYGYYEGKANEYFKVVRL